MVEEEIKGWQDDTPTPASQIWNTLRSYLGIVCSFDNNDRGALSFILERITP